MQRKEFVRQTGIMAIGIGVFGRVQWDNGHFVGDTPTTTDILGIQSFLIYLCTP